MNNEQIFKEKITSRIWSGYFRRIDKITRRMEETQKKELILEIKGHLFESMSESGSRKEPEALLDALDRMGEPEVFLRLMMADKYVTRATKTLSPRAVARVLYYTLFRGFKWASISFLFFLGYFLLLLCGVMALFKPLFPRNVGVFMTHRGGPVIGIIGNSANVKTDILGYWVIPLGLILAALLYFGLTKLLKILKQPYAKSS